MTINTTAQMATADYGNQKISTVNLYWLWVHKPFNLSTLYQLSTCIGCGFTSHSTFQLYINCQLVLAVGSQAIQPYNFISTNINCQLVLAVGSQAIQRFNFISTNFQPSTDNVNWFCCNTDNSTLVLHCISKTKYMKSS